MANAYATDLELMDRLGMDPDDARRGTLDDVLEASSRWIDRTTGHRFYAVSETRYYTLGSPFNNGGARIEVDDLLSVSALATDHNGDGAFETTWTAVTDYWLGPRNAVVRGEPYTMINRTSLTGRYYFPSYEEAVKVTGEFGYSTLITRPLVIRELCLMVASHLAGVSSLSTIGSTVGDLAIPGVQEYSIGTELTVKMQRAVDVMTAGQLPDPARRIIEMFKKPSFVV